MNQTDIWMWTPFNRISLQEPGYSWASWHYWTGMRLLTLWTTESLNMPLAELQKLQQSINLLDCVFTILPRILKGLHCSFCDFHLKQKWAVLWELIWYSWTAFLISGPLLSHVSTFCSTFHVQPVSLTARSLHKSTSLQETAAFSDETQIFFCTLCHPRHWPEEDSEERERTESACADICPFSVTFHPGIPQTGIVFVHLIVLSTFSSMNLPNHFLNSHKFITASHGKKFHSLIIHYTRDSILLFALNL